MLHKTKFLLATTALMACMAHTAPSFSDTMVRETVTETPGNTTVKKTVTETTPHSTSTQTTTTETRWVSVENGAHVINPTESSLIQSGGLSRSEIGELLFKIYDTDGNGLLDSNEYEHREIITVMPVQKDTVISYHYDADGKLDKTRYTYETFMQDTLLARFDGHNEGLSPHEFTGMDFAAVDVNHDHGINLDEWQGTYTASIDKVNKEKALFNK